LRGAFGEAARAGALRQVTAQSGNAGHATMFGEEAPERMPPAQLGSLPDANAPSASDE